MTLMDKMIIERLFNVRRYRRRRRRRHCLTNAPLLNQFVSTKNTFLQCFSHEMSWMPLREHHNKLI